MIKYKLRFNLASEYLYLLQLLFFIAIVSILLYFAVREYPSSISKAHMVNSFGSLSILRQEITLFHAHSGRWPDKSELPTVYSTQEDDSGLNFQDTDVKDGSIKLNVDSKNSKLGKGYIIFQRVDTSQSGSVRWVCNAETLSKSDMNDEFQIDPNFQYQYRICR